jgi:hypothetical protein
MQDILGSEKNVQVNKQIVTSEFASLSIGGNMALVQSFTGRYGREIAPIYAAGSSTVYFVPGPSTGSIEASAAVGKTGFFANFKNTNCGTVSNISVSVKGAGKCAVQATGTVRFSDGLLQNLGLQFAAGPSAIVTESVSVFVGAMEVV